MQHGYATKPVGAASGVVVARGTRRLQEQSSADAAAEAPADAPPTMSNGALTVGRPDRGMGRQLRDASTWGIERKWVMAKAAHDSLADMARRPNVLFAASNVYDAMYLRRAFDAAPVPWPGIALQLAGLAYTGTRSEVLFCCGNGPYNKAIKALATTIQNATKMVPTSITAHEPAGGSVASSSGLTFAWIREMYSKPSECTSTRPSSAVASASATTVSNSPPAQTRRCGYAYSDLASHPLAVLLPYSMHSYGLVQVYALGVPILAPSLALLAELHATLGICNHKGGGNVPWRRSKERERVPYDTWAWLLHTKHSWFSPPVAAGAPCCAHDPNDSCDATAAARWLQFADWYQWPNVTYFDTLEQLLSSAALLMRDSKRRHAISRDMKVPSLPSSQPRL